MRLAAHLVSPIKSGHVVPAGGTSAIVYTRLPNVVTGSKTAGISCQSYPILAGSLAMAGMQGEYHLEDAGSRPGILKLVAGYDNQKVADVMATLAGIKGFYTEDEGHLKAFLDTHLLTIDSTPNNVHVPNAQAIFARSDAAARFLYLEKPPAEDERAAARLVKLEQKYPGQIAVVSQNRWWDCLLDLRHMLLAGEIGDVQEAEVEYLQDWMNAGCPAYWRTQLGVGGENLAVADGGIGKLLDILQHAVDVSTFAAKMRIMNIASAVIRQNVMEREDPSKGGGTFQAATETAAKLKVGGKTRYHGDDTIFAIAEFANGAPLKVTVTQTQAGHKNHLRVRYYGTKGSLEFDTDNANQLVKYGFGNRTEIITRSPGDLVHRASLAPWIREGMRLNNPPFGGYTPSKHDSGWRGVTRNGLISYALYAQLVHHGILTPANRKDLFMVPTTEEVWTDMRAIKGMYLSAAKGRSQAVNYDLSRKLG